MAEVGKREVRVDAFDKATGRTKYYEDLMPQNALYVRIKHAEIAHGFVKSVDTAAAETIDGVVKVLTCFDVPDIPFPTAGHPWSMDPGHQDVADRHLLNRHVRYYGDDVAVVIAENEVAAMQGVRALKVEYEELPFVLDVQKAMEPDAPQIHENYPGNILKHTDIRKGDYAAAIQEPGLVKVEGWYETPTVQHCHIENHGCYAYEENGRVVVVSSTQIPHIIRRIVGQALGRPWADIEIIKPYIGGGFGNKQDALYEPLCAWCSTQVNGRCVRIDCSREETFVSNRVRHAIRFHIVSWLRKDGQLAARKVECFSNQGAYASHGHSICAKALGSFAQIYPCDHMECDGWTVFTNRPAAGAMRGYGMPQASFADEANIDECAAAVGMDPLEYRMKFITTLAVTFFAGMGAGLGTGFAGMSAAAVISPMLITFLGMDPYMAVGIALASDVLASAVSAYTYHKNKNLDIRNGIIMMVTVLLFTVAGSYIASLVPSRTMGSFSVIMTFLLGVKFIVRPVMTTKEAMLGVSAKKRAVQSVVCGIVIGFICGFVGAGGGMMMLLILTTVLGYELKTAVGTSVFIMAFTALTGAISHFTIGGAPDWTVLALCVVFTLIWARIAAVFANKAEPKTLNRATGVVLVILGAAIMTFNLLK